MLHKTKHILFIISPLKIYILYACNFYAILSNKRCVNRVHKKRAVKGGDNGSFSCFYKLGIKGGDINLTHKLKILDKLQLLSQNYQDQYIALHQLLLWIQRY